uniref:Serendipity locus protein alpha n=1 Tax=Anopheles christyi TaxID=43041 RepID=A0A182K6W1_9DIPT
MFPELQECIQTAQDNLYRGFIPTNKAGLQWLDSVCADLHRLLRFVHKHLIFDGNGNAGTLETCFLCISQIVMCIRWLEKTIAMEMESSGKPQTQGLRQARQCFLDRIIWCLERLKAALESDDTTESVTDSNFVSYLDLALSLIAPLTVASDEGCVGDEYETRYNEVIVESGRIRSVIEALISQTFSFCTVIPEQDRNRVTGFCQKVMKECVALERESEGKDTCDKKLRVSMLESAIYQLETHVNECLLRLVYDTFGDTDRMLLAQLRTNIKGVSCEEQIDEVTKPFDSFVERLMQIGLFAISYADSLKISSSIRSCLASLEALDSYLIPSLYHGADRNSMLLEHHWLEESANLCRLVHKIIDTNAFALSLQEMLDSALDAWQQSFNLPQALELVRKADVFLQHIELNASEVKLHEERLSIHYADYRTMVLECRAIVQWVEKRETNVIDTPRIVKRFRVLQGKLRKIQTTISTHSKDTRAVAVEEEGTSSAAEESVTSPERHKIEANVRELFSATQARLSSTNILYRSRRGVPGKQRLEAASLLEINAFTDIITHRARDRAVTSPEKGSVRRRPIRRNSLRVAMFKKQQRDQTTEMYESIKNDIDLQITEILDELTDLSSTFSTHTMGKLLPTDVEHPPATAISKSITNEEIAIVDDNKIRINIYTDL